MKMKANLGFLGILCCIIAVLDAGTVTVNEASQFKKPGEDLVLECTGSEKSLAYYIKNRVNWAFVDVTGAKHEITASFYQAPNSAYALPLFESGHFSFEYFTGADGHYIYQLKVIEVTHEDNGQYVCSLINEAKETEDQATVNVTVVRPVDTVKVELLDHDGKRVKSSTHVITEDTMAVQLNPGHFTVKCTASGSNPEPMMELIVDDVALNIKPTTTKSVVGKTVQYKGMVSESLDLMAKAAEQVVSCDAHIGGSYYPKQAASILLMVEIDEPHVACINLTRAVGDKFQSISCNITAPSGLTCSKVNWVLADGNKVMHPDSRYKDPTGVYDIMEVSCMGTDSMLKTSLTFHLLKEAHFKAVYFVQYGIGENTHRFGMSVDEDKSRSAGVTIPMSVLLTMVMAIVSKHLL